MIKLGIKRRGDKQEFGLYTVVKIHTGYFSIFLKKINK